MATDLSCGCRTAPKERLCSYHEGRADERDLIVQWLLREPNVWLNRAAWAIERGTHIDGTKRLICEGCGRAIEPDDEPHTFCYPGQP